MSEDEPMDPVTVSAAIGAAAKISEPANTETSALISRLLGPSVDVIAEDWATRLRQRNLKRLLAKTEERAAGESPGWVQPRVAAAVFESAQYADDEIVTDYLSGVLASSRREDGGTDDALPWSSLVSRLSSLQLRSHFVIYLNLRRVLLARPEVQRIFDFESINVIFPMRAFFAAIGLDLDEDERRFGDAVHGLRQEGLIAGYSWGNREYMNTQHGNSDGALKHLPRKLLDCDYEEVLLVQFTPFGVQMFLWGIGSGSADDLLYLDPGHEFTFQGLVEADAAKLLDGVAMLDDSWGEVAPPQL